MSTMGSTHAARPFLPKEATASQRRSCARCVLAAAAPVILNLVFITTLILIHTQVLTLPGHALAVAVAIATAMWIKLRICYGVGRTPSRANPCLLAGPCQHLWLLVCSCVPWGSWKGGNERGRS